MPVLLVDRCGPDTVAEFRSAAVVRYDDGARLAGRGRRTAAIYLWGYAAEMTIKAAFFTAFGFPEDRVITAAHLRTARDVTAAHCGILWPAPGWGHNLVAWAELLAQYRSL